MSVRIGVISLLIFFLVYPSYSQRIVGCVQNESGEPLVGTNIRVENSNLGTTTNPDGYYLLKLEPGEFTIIYSFLGYRSDTLRVRLSEEQEFRHDVVLRESALPGEAVYVFARPLSDAEQIVIKTIDNKSRYLAGLKNYVYQAYNKTVLRVKYKGKKVIGGLLETQSRCYYQYPDRFEEVILSRRQSANFSEAHNMFTLGRAPNVLEDVIKIDELPVVSPLAGKALDYYSYEMIDTTYQDGRAVFNIRFFPARKDVPLFSGKVSILDGVFAPVYIELEGNEGIKTAIRENVIIREKFRKYQNTFYLPVQVTIHSLMKMGIPGVPPVYFEQFSLLFDYRINSPEFRHQFTNTVLQISTLPASQSDSLWRNNQILPLSEEEQRAYHRLDSIVARSSWRKKLLFKSLRLQPALSRLPVTGISDFYHFNRVEGHALGFGLDSRDYLGTYRVKIILNRGLDDRRWKYFFQISDWFHSGLPGVFFSLFDRLQFQDAFYHYSVLDLTWQSLVDKNDYAHYYLGRGFDVGLNLKIDPHTRFDAGLEFTRQRSVDVHTNWSVLHRDKPYLPNLPIDEGRVNMFHLKFQYDNRKFYDFGWLKQPDMAENFLVLNVTYSRSDSRLLGSEFEFRQYYLFARIYRISPPWFHFSLGINAGQIEGDLLRQRLFHLPGSYGSLSGPLLFRSILRDEYRGKRFFCLFLENNFRNTIFNLFHLPYLQKSKYNLFLFGNLGWMDTFEQSGEDIYRKLNSQPLFEVGFGIGNIFTFLRFDFTWRLDGKRKNFFFTIAAS